MDRRLLAFGALLFPVLLPAALARALPPNFVETPGPGSWNFAVGLTFASDGRMFVWERAGRVWTVEDGVKAGQPLIDISPEVGSWGDHGLLGFAIDPDFYSNGYIYLLYVVDYHHLVYYGTPQYNPGLNEYFKDTIARLTRYTCNAADGFRSVDDSSRIVLIGESVGTGFPVCNFSHGAGALGFGEDGTLLASCGDGASTATVDIGQTVPGSSNTAVADGIITLVEDVGAYRAQLVNSLAGKIVRIDAATGDGLPSNPFYDPMAPRAPRSRVWAVGLRNPCRFTLRPGSGSVDPTAGDPGTLFIGDVGWSTWEELNVSTGAGENFGWPNYEGMTTQPSYSSALGNVANLDARNPLFGTTPPGLPPCNQSHFDFKDLIIQQTLNRPSYPNPCDPSQPVPDTTPTFVHRRPAIDWKHPDGPARTGTFVDGEAAVAEIGAPGAPVTGPQFGGGCSIAGVWYNGTAFPPEWRNTYFHADYASGWIFNIVFDENDGPVEVRPFVGGNTGLIVALAVDPVSGELHYIKYGLGEVLRKISWSSNLPPNVVVDAEPGFGPAPLTVQLTGSGSSDIDQQPLAFTWVFGDGTPVSRRPDPIHVYPSDDLSNAAQIIAKIMTLDPPYPLGDGSQDPEVIRDYVYPSVARGDSTEQYDTFHNGDQGDEDWIGYHFPQDRTLYGLQFQEGIHFAGGGWFDNVQVQLLVDDVWIAATGVVITPPYAGNNGVNFEIYEISFAPTTARGIRLYGDPGGDASFISVGELRVTGAPLAPPTAPTAYNASLTVTDSSGAAATAATMVSVNNTPPTVVILSPEFRSTYSVTAPTTFPLVAEFFDGEFFNDDLSCQWQTILHHENHIHPERPDANCTSQTTFQPIGCDGESYYYEVTLAVSDPAGLSTMSWVYVWPDCSANYGDFDLDGDVDLLDFRLLEICMPPLFGEPQICPLVDSNNDQVFDLVDYALLAANLTGP